MSGRYIEQLSTQRHLVRAVPIREQTIMTNAMEPIGKHVEQEAAHELANGELHDFVLVVAILTVVLPAEADMALVEIEQTGVGDRDTVGVAGEIGEDLLGTGEGLLDIDDPFAVAQRREVGLPRLGVFELAEIGEERKDRKSVV